MAYVRFSLMGAGDLSTIASPGVGQAAHLPPNFPNTGGLYMIFNANHDNRYVGAAGNLQDRFAPRITAVNDLGLAQADLRGQNGLYVYWGLAQAYDSPVQLPGAQPLPPFNPLGSQLTAGFYLAQQGQNQIVAVPNNYIGFQSLAPNYSLGSGTTIDGFQVNVEALLIRFIRQVEFGGTMTNLQYMGEFQNPTANQLIVQLELGAVGVLPTEYRCITIPANGAF